jgi:hypothetical protein
MICASRSAESAVLGDAGGGAGGNMAKSSGGTPMAKEGSATVETLRDQAERCRRLARAISDSRVASALLKLAGEFDERAAAMESRPPDEPD